MKGKINLLVWIARVVLSAVFIFSGMVKGIDPMGTAIKIEEYFATASLPMSSTLATVGAVLLCLCEFTLGVALLVGVWRRLAGALATVMMTAMTLLTLYIMVNNPVSDCGCFGDAVRLSNEATFVKNVVLLPLAFVLLHYSAYVQPLLSFRRGKLFVVGVGLVMLHFLVATLIDLPAVDFRPFKVGTDIMSLKYAQKEQQDEVDNLSFVYEKDGVQKTFGMDELDQVDSTWVFIKETSERPTTSIQVTAADLALMDLNGEDVLLGLMRNQPQMMIYCSGLRSHEEILKDRPRLEKLSRIAYDQNASLYIATGHVVPHDFDAPIWTLRDIASLYYMDPTIMKTVVRSDPALLIIRDGVLLRKVADRRISSLIEDEDFVARPFDSKANIKAYQQAQVWKFVPFVVVLLVFGLLLYFNKKDTLTYKPQ